MNGVAADLTFSDLSNDDLDELIAAGVMGGEYRAYSSQIAEAWYLLETAGKLFAPRDSDARRVPTITKLAQLWKRADLWAYEPAEAARQICVLVLQATNGCPPQQETAGAGISWELALSIAYPDRSAVVMPPVRLPRKAINADEIARYDANAPQQWLAARRANPNPPWLFNENLYLYDWSIGLFGRPDQIVYVEGAPIPVLIVAANAPSEPCESDMLHIAAYCLLLHSSTNVRPDFGIVQYLDRKFATDYTPELEEELMDTLAEMAEFLD